MLITNAIQNLLKLAAILASIIFSNLIFAQAADPDPNRFADEIQVFTQWDAKNTSPENPIVFVGSSSIRFWNTGERFPDKPVVNRGFGGAHISDVLSFMDETVLRYSPKMVIFYAGDNDIYDGKSINQVVADYTQFVNLVHATYPSTDIVYIPIKPSIARWTLWPQMSAANVRIREFTKKADALHYVDLAAPILGKDELPRPEFFVEDGLHLSSAGYDAWSEKLATFLDTFRHN